MSQLHIISVNYEGRNIKIVGELFIVNDTFSYLK